MWLVPIAISYLLGSVPFGYITTYLVKKIDIRNYGSGNIGATNVARILGKRWGSFVFFLDFLKGFISMLMAYLFFSCYSYWLFILVALASIAGHNWSIFLRFKGGKGVSTSIGATLGLCFKYFPLSIPLFVSLFVWIIVFFIFKYVSLASLLATFFFFLLSIIILEWEFKIFSLFIFILIVIRHKKNIKNLLQGKELGV